MEKIKIEIKQLGAIKDSVIEISPVMLFSGESGLGKSYLAMLCHYFFDVLLDEKRIHRYIESKGWNFVEMRDNFKNSGTALIISKSDFQKWLAEDCLAYLRWMLNNDDLQGEFTVYLPAKIEENIEIHFEEEILGLVSKEDVYLKLRMLGLTYRIKEGSIEEESPFAFLFRHGLIQQIFGDFHALQDTYVFPPSRGPMLTEDVDPRTGLYEKYKNCVFKLDRVNPQPGNVSVELKELFAAILNGTVARKEGKYMYSIPQGEIPISAAAASVREVAPLALLVERTDISKISVLIEEPEAHLHPLKQRMMAEVISCFVNAGTYMQITTHSDYLLRRLNELIGLKKLERKMSDDPVRFWGICAEFGVEQGLALDYSKISAYLLQRREDGTTEIVKQEIADGVPFESFTQAIDESLEHGYKIYEYLAE